MDKGSCKCTGLVIYTIKHNYFQSLSLLVLGVLFPDYLVMKFSFQLKEKLKQYGIENIEDLTLVEDSNSEGMNRGFAFLEFSSRSDAMDAYRRLQKRNVVFGVDRPAKVSFADSFIDPGDRIMAQVNVGKY